jgi:hypothetical protein
MVSWTVMFGEVVGEVDGTGCPEHVELALVNAACYKRLKRAGITPILQRFDNRSCGW